MNLLATLAAALRPKPAPAAVPSAPRRHASPKGELANLSANATAATISAAIRAAEGGNVAQLFALYRDSLLSDDLVQGCFNTRKLAVLAQPLAVMPKRRGNPDDMAAMAAVNRAIADCENWHDAIGALLDSCLWPVSVAEKVFAPATEPEADGEPRLTWTLRRIEPVNPALFCFLHGYKEPDFLKAGGQTDAPWEPWLRLWSLDPSGVIVTSDAQAEPMDATRHIVHRGHLLTGFRDNWGGPMRAVLGWWLLRALSREWWGRFQERYGSPFPVGKTNMADAGAVAFLENAFSLSTKIGGMVISADDTVELVQAANAGGAEGHRLWNQVCSDAISRAITGVEASAAPAGLNAGQSQKAENVREDVRMFDQLKLCQTLERQLFAQFLQVNGLPGRVRLSFGGLSDADAAMFATTLQTLGNAGFEPADEALPTVQDRLGMAVRRKAAPISPGPLTRPAGTLSTSDGEREGAGDAPERRPPARLGEDEDGGLKIEDGTERRPPARLGEDEDGGLKIEDGTERRPPARPGAESAKVKTFSAQAGAAQALGVPPGWLNPVAEFLSELQRKAEDASLSDADLLAFLDKAKDRVPELFGRMDVKELGRVLEASMGQAVIDSVRLGVRQGKTG